MTGSGSAHPAPFARSDICNFRNQYTAEDEKTHRLWSRRVLVFYASMVTILVVVAAGARHLPFDRAELTSMGRATRGESLESIALASRGSHPTPQSRNDFHLQTAY
jgi:hypothetical protein